jgi:hypothetical protein
MGFLCIVPVIVGQKREVHGTHDAALARCGMTSFLGIRSVANGLLDGAELLNNRVARVEK